MATHVIQMIDLPQDPDAYIRYCGKLELCIALGDVIRNLVILEPRKNDTVGRASLPGFMNDPDFPKFPATFAQAMIGAEQEAFLQKLKKHVADARKYFASIEANQPAQRAWFFTRKWLVLKSVGRDIRSTLADDDELTMEKVVQTMETRFALASSEGHHVSVELVH